MDEFWGEIANKIDSIFKKAVAVDDKDIILAKSVKIIKELMIGGQCPPGIDFDCENQPGDHCEDCWLNWIDTVITKEDITEEV